MVTLCKVSRSCQSRSNALKRLNAKTFLRREADLAGRHTLNERLVTLAEMKGGARFHQVVEGPLSGKIKLFPRGILLNR